MVKTPVLFLSLLFFAIYASSSETNLSNRDFCVAAVNLQRKARPNETAVQDCCDAFLLGGRTGVYWYRSVGRSQRVFCDMTTDGGGWIVVLRRLKELPKRRSDFFERSQKEYRRGFGLLDRNFWFGLNKLYKLTTRSNVYAQVRFELMSSDDREFWLEYDTFAVGPETNNYTLTIGNYSGGNLPDLFYVLNGRNFMAGGHCGTPTMWWYPGNFCRCLDPFITR